MEGRIRGQVCGTHTNGNFPRVYYHYVYNLKYPTTNSCYMSGGDFEKSNFFQVDGLNP